MDVANQVSSAGSQPSNQAGDLSTELTTTQDDDIGSMTVSSDLWSAAYREAVESLGKDIDVAILMGNNTAQLFKELEEIDKEATQESAFLRGVAYLRSIQVPLERFKLALDLASPLSRGDPTATTVFGVLRGVTAVSLFCLSYCAYDGECVETVDLSEHRLP